MNRPRLGVAVLVTNVYGQLLLGRRGKEPNAGLWIIPGGGVELGETIEQTAYRELREETGIAGVDELDPQPVYVQEVISEGTWEQEHRVILFVKARVSYPRLMAGSDLLTPRFFARERIADLTISPVCIPALQAQGWLPLSSARIL